MHITPHVPARPVPLYGRARRRSAALAALLAAVVLGTAGTVPVARADTAAAPAPPPLTARPP
ncbi:hypothetical protein Smic_70050 [Streptomyces microflavus]|uniref:Uncharacterized protein n=1 Tax=Streptomyces microflavus TaxID=1919 RepID=A0A7J0D1Q8_STRMI|nr:hypothetical protein Smic_70050 [Streptomyces microflavus]